MKSALMWFLLTPVIACIFLFVGLMFLLFWPIIPFIVYFDGE